MHRRFCVYCLLIVLSLFAALPAFAQYTVTDLNTFYPDPLHPGQYVGASYAYGINNYSQVVGQADLPPPPMSSTLPHHAFLYSGSTLTDIGTLYPDPNNPGKYFGNSVAYGINDYGQVVGASDTSTPNTSHAFLWTPSVQRGTSGTMVDLGTFYTNNSHNSQARSIDKDGKVVGGAMLPISSSKLYQFVTHPFLWTPATTNGTSGTMQDLAPLILPAGTAYTINPHVSSITQITGQATNGDNGAGHGGGYVSADSDPFLWTSSSGWGYIDSVHSANNPDPAAGGFGINDAGVAVGHWSDLNIDVACKWVSGSHTYLGSLQTSGISTSTAYAINNLASYTIVGDSSTNSGVTHAFIYQSSMVDLNTLIPVNSGWVLNSAHGVNNSVQIVGFGTTGSQTHAFWLH